MPCAFGDRCEVRAKWLAKFVVMACDCATKRVEMGTRKQNKYWWNADIADARNLCNSVRRKLRELGSVMDWWTRRVCITTTRRSVKICVY